MATTKINGATQIAPNTIPTSALQTATVVLADGSIPFVGNQSMGSNKLRDLDAPTLDTDATNKQYVDAVAIGLSIKASCRVATTANITLSGTQTIDGVSVAVGNRVLVKNQTSGDENGIYVVASGAWTRPSDFDSDNDVVNGAFTFIKEGSTQADTGWVLTTNDPITVNVTALTFTQFSAAGVFGASNHVTRETPSGAVNGINVTYTLAYTPTTGTEHVYLNGLLQTDGGADYSISGVTITFTTAPQTNDVLRVSYLK